MDAATLITVARNSKTIAAFVSGGGLDDAVSMIVGDVHLNAAKLALNASQISTDPVGRINSVITHLEAAHCAYEAVHFKADRFLKKATDWQQIRNSVAKDAWVCCLMALCYAYLEDYQAVESCLCLAERAFTNGKRESNLSEGAALWGIPMVFIGLLNIRNWKQTDQNFFGEKQFMVFRSELNRAIARTKPGQPL
jgi:predicted SprT family Zn-dependent metalloprotease